MPYAFLQEREKNGFKKAKNKRILIKPVLGL
jgi:hypothetical protein